jgi:hypothetical protein
LAKSPNWETSIAPRIVKSICPPRIIANESSEEKYDDPGMTVTVSFPALIKSASTWNLNKIIHFKNFERQKIIYSSGKGPSPKIPFSDCKCTVILSGM